MEHAELHCNAISWERFEKVGEQPSTCSGCLHIPPTAGTILREPFDLRSGLGSMSRIATGSTTSFDYRVDVVSIEWKGVGDLVFPLS